MFHSAEYTTLIKGDDEIVIKPFIDFKAIPAGYKASSSAIIRNQDNEVVMILIPGTTTSELKLPQKKTIRKKPIKKQEKT